MRIDENVLSPEPNRKNLFTHLLYPPASTPHYEGGKERYQPPTSQELLEEALTVMCGGVEEASNAIMYGIHYLLTTKGVMEKLKLELRRIWPNRETPITYLELEKSQYFVSNLFVCGR